MSRRISKASLVAVVAVSIVASMGIVACSENNQPVSPDDENSMITSEKQIAPAPGFLPDLIVTSVSSNSPLVTVCGTALPNATCRVTTYNVTVANIGARRVNANEATV